ncbi:AraC-like DNA-binding protein [Bacteroides zoogleoformans]|uniref:AraC family transcriptional regulator n=1 Tax=Bacteroides zoogleoformans TaxID=28119 RepID=A0ABN5IIL8_9BACE|nr:AraC family transcriptional regulator [Bacteroides zoogleoformans]AVM52587.1 AraC family transcriptional regulator [Bacteroides zoogleoformans]TWJ14141.1 AraC-like DNA-binding protein [Bacteroides zoogleoformans]
MQTSFTGDPSTTMQYFPGLSIKIHCCRYWWLKNWEYSTLSFPFWRIYHNIRAGGVIEYRGRTYHMEPDKVYLIAPNTDYSSHIEGNHIPRQGNCLCGGSIASLTEDEREELQAAGAIGHLFVHFSLGFPYDNALTGVFPIELTESLKAKVDYMQHYLLTSGQITTFSLGAFLKLQALICEILLSVEEGQWKPNAGDVRIAQTISYIEGHYEENLSNELLADRACMATNSFSRLFKNETGVTLQNFVKKKRIDYACMLIIHTDMSIKEIAAKTGFSNRFHFTRVFCEVMKVTPGKYRDMFLFPTA